MFIAMNRFLITKGQEEAFVVMWRQRDSYLHGVSGFIIFHLLRGSETEKGTVFVSHSTWEPKQAFDDWVHSDAFKKAHTSMTRNNSSSDACMYQGAPRLETFNAVL